MAYERRDYSGSAAATTLATNITASATSITVPAANGWPDGQNGKFLVAIGRGTASEEKILVQSRSGTTLTLASSSDRGAEGTTAQAHNAGDAVEHVAGATDADEANNLVSQTLGTVTTKGDSLVATGTGALTREPVGANNTVHVADNAQTTGRKWSQVDQNMLSTSVAGNGLSGGNGTALTLNVDGSTLEISSDVARVKDLGVTTAKLAAAVVDDASLQLSGGNIHVKAAGVTNAMLAGSIATSKLTLPSWTSFTPTWASTVGTPALGNGTVVASYLIFGKTMWVQMHYTFGSSTTFGGSAGAWSFGIGGGQTSIAADQTVSAMIVGPGSARYAATGLINASSSSIQRVAVSDGSTGIGNGTTPFTWGAGHQVVITGSFGIV